MHQYRPVIALLPSLFAASSCWASAEQQQAPRQDLRSIRRSEVAQHKTPATGIWVIHKDGVYDISKVCSSSLLYVSLRAKAFNVN
jgi:hypothetical protein